MNEKIISALVGLVGAYGNNGKTPNTDSIIMEALLNCFQEVDEDAIVSKIHKEKYTISPNCKTCTTPCGNTSDYDMQKFHSNDELQAIKVEMLKETVALTERLRAANKVELPEDIYRSITYFGYDFVEESYRDLIALIKQMEV